MYLEIQCCVDLFVCLFGHLYHFELYNLHRGYKALQSQLFSWLYYHIVVFSLQPLGNIYGVWYLALFVNSLGPFASFIKKA